MGLRVLRFALLGAWLISSISGGVAAAIPCGCPASAFFAFDHTREELELFAQGEVKRTFDSASVVFVGRAVWSADFERTIVEVDRVWKGDLPKYVHMVSGVKQADRNTITVSSCSYFAPPTWTVIFAYRAPNGDLSSSACTPNTPLSNADEIIGRLNRLAPAQAPRTDQNLTTTTCQCFPDDLPANMTAAERTAHERRATAAVFQEAEVVFVGTVVSRNPERVEVEVDRLWKGTLLRRVMMSTGTTVLAEGVIGRNSCISQLETSGPTLIFGTRDARNELITFACSPNGPTSKVANTLRQLDSIAKSYKPVGR